MSVDIAEIFKISLADQCKRDSNTLNVMDGRSVPAPGHQDEGLNCRMFISQLLKSSAGGRLSTAEKTDPW